MKKRNSSINSRFFKIINIFLSFILLLLLPTQWGKHFFPSFSFLDGVRVDYLAPTLYLIDIVIIALAVINRRLIVRFFFRKIFIPIFLLMIANIIFSLSPSLTFYKAARLIEFLVLLPLGQKIFAVLKEKTILLAFLLSAFVELFLGFWQLVSKHSVQGIFYFLGERLFNISTPGIAKGSINGIEFLRPYGTFSHPNSMGGFYLLVYFFFLIDKRLDKYILLKFFSLFVFTCLVFLSFSKGAIISYLILNLLYFFKKRFSCKFCQIAKISAISIVSMVFITVQSDLLSIEKRIHLVKNALSIIADYVLFGVGGGAYLLAQAEIPAKVYLFFNQPVHNIFLLFIAEYGMIFFLFSAYLVIKYLTEYRITKNQWLLILAIIITGFFDHYWLTLLQNYLLAGVVLSRSIGDLWRSDR